MAETPTPGFPELEQGSLPRTIEKSVRPKKSPIHFVIGVDEAGRGPLAGPVVAAAFTFAKANSPTPSELSKGVTDSKQVSEPAREFMYMNNIRNNNKVKYTVSVIDNKIIDEINILQATFRAMSESALNLMDQIRRSHPDATFSILIDGNKVPPQLAHLDCQAVIKGDSLEFLIAAASICAKVERDELMRQIDSEFPMYGFRQHKGYPTASHVAAISKHGPCKYHRMTFAPLKHMGARKCKPKRTTENEVPVETASVPCAREGRLKRRNLMKEKDI
jgi:ribonuclease HII